MKVRSNALSLLASVGITAYCAHAATGDPVPPPSLRDLDLVEKPWPELASSWRHFLPAHEPGANQPAPDPSQEGNWPAGVAPLLGGAGGTAIELGWRCNALCDPLHHNPNRNPNLPMDFGSKSKSKSTIKNLAKCLNSMAVGPG